MNDVIEFDEADRQQNSHKILEDKSQSPKIDKKQDIEQILKTEAELCKNSKPPSMGPSPGKQL